MRWIIAAAAIAAAVTGMALGAGALPVKIEAIRMQLFYETTGTLSADITPTPDSWANTVIGEGAAKEPANDIMVSVVLSSKTDEANVASRTR